MPEYLAPGVFVEEIDTGNKPIEGVSTSTTGVVGITERGPVDVPILVTSYGLDHLGMSPRTLMAGLALLLLLPAVGFRALRAANRAR